MTERHHKGGWPAPRIEATRRRLANGGYDGEAGRVIESLLAEIDRLNAELRAQEKQ
jgi:hypothetical protein